MKIVTLLASPHGEKGNTGKLLKEVYNGIGSAATCETIVLKGDDLKQCTGCDMCHKRGYCHLKDDFESIKEKILSADGIILSTPNYIFHVSAQLKTFFDRASTLFHCMSLENKYAAFVVTSGGGDEKPIVDYLSNMMIFCGATPVDAVWAEMGTFSPENRLDDLSIDLAQNLGKNLVKAIKEKWRFSHVEKMKENHKKRMLELINYYKDNWTYEYNYWQKRLNKGEGDGE
jgi:multimeric flavodoxin WrbA